MGTTHGRPALLWLRRLLVVAGMLLGGWLLGASPASADSDLTDLANELIDRASAGEDIGGLIDSAITGAVETVAPAPAEEETAEPAPAEEETSSASGSTTSVPGVERENTTTWGGVDYGPDPGSSWGWTANRVEPVTAAAATAAPPKVAPRSGTPPSPAKTAAPAPVRAPVAQDPAPVARSVEAPAARGERTAPADEPADRPAPPAPSAPGSGSSAGSAHDGGNSYRGAPGVLATRDHAGAPSGGWPIAYPQVLGAAVEAAGTPTSRPD